MSHQTTFYYPPLLVPETSRFSPEEMDTVHEYTENMSEPINIYLANDKDTRWTKHGKTEVELRAFIKDLDYIIKTKGNVVGEEKLHLYRGVRKEEDISLNYPSYMSTSTELNVVKEFYDVAAGCCIFHIIVLPGVKYLDLSKPGMSKNPHEKEILLERGLQLKSIDLVEEPYYDEMYERYINKYKLVIGKPVGILPVFGSSVLQGHLKTLAKTPSKTKKGGSKTKKGGSKTKKGGSKNKKGGSKNKKRSRSRRKVKK